MMRWVVCMCCCDSCNNSQVCCCSQTEPVLSSCRTTATPSPPAWHSGKGWTCMGAVPGCAWMHGRPHVCRGSWPSRLQTQAGQQQASAAQSTNARANSCSAAHSNTTASCAFASTDLPNLLTVLMKSLCSNAAACAGSVLVPWAQAARSDWPQSWSSALARCNLRAYFLLQGATCIDTCTRSIRLSCKSACVDQ